MSSEQSNLKKLVLVFTAKGVKGIGGLLLAWVLAKKYGAYGAGLFFIGYTFAFLCANFAQLGLGNACLRYIPQIRISMNPIFLLCGPSRSWLLVVLRYCFLAWSCSMLNQLQVWF